MTFATGVPPESAETWSQPAGPHVLRGRLLGQADLHAVVALHKRVLASLPPGILNAETHEFFAEHVADVGRLLGVETAAGEMVAYAVLGLPSAAAAYNFGRDISLPALELAAVAHLDGVGVAPTWRGHGLQRALSLRRIALAAAAGRRHMVTTVAPANLHSLRNCLALGFRVVVTRPMFAAGHMRHLLHLDLAPQIPAETTPVDAGVLIAVGHLPDPAIRFNPVLAAVAPAPPGDGG